MRGHFVRDGADDDDARMSEETNLEHFGLTLDSETTPAKRVLGK
jgi:hypothetical protein